MTTLHIILISLFIGWPMHIVMEIKKNAEKCLHPCGLSSYENCCIFAQSNFDKYSSGVYKMKSWYTGYLSIVDMYTVTLWVVLQRRKDGSENFHRPWADSERGFGDLNGNW